MASGAPRPLVAGNWKMNGTTVSLNEARLMAGMLKDVELNCDVMICPPATLVSRLSSLMKASHISLGGQDCHWEEKGAHTGDISAEMLADAGCSAVIVGHSERRTDHGETDVVVSRKAAAAHRARLTAILCIGETLEERKAGRTLEVTARQLRGSLPASALSSNTVIAYEPVWAIGTGLTPTVPEVAEVHAHIRSELAGILSNGRSGDIRILYGGSVKPSNAAELMGAANVNGALVGGASLKAADFIGIIKVYA
jgi:triosephosphate isomerase (TIM)